MRPDTPYRDRAVLEMVGNDSLSEQLFHNLCLNAIEP